MTIQQAFERSNFVEFIPSDNAIILFFQNESIMMDFFEAIKIEAIKNEFYLEVKILTEVEQRIQLIINDANKQPIYTSGELGYRLQEFEKFVEN